MLDYISVKEAAQKWGISERRVQKLCEGSQQFFEWRYTR